MIAEFVANAARGDQVEYARGNLSLARWERTELSRARVEVPEPLDAMCDAANDAWRAHQRGDVTLIQRRMGRDDFSYLAVRL